MVTGRWRVCFTPWAATWVPSRELPFERRWLEDWDEWLRREDVLPRTPFLISPGCEYDVALNEFFLDSLMAARSPRTLEGYARDLAAFLNFLWLARDGRSWRDVTAADHVAYLSWRRRDSAGPRVAGSTWNREVAAVNQFYRWAVQRGHVRANPVPQAGRGGRLQRRAGLVAGRASRARRRTRMTRAGSGSSGCRRLLTASGETSVSAGLIRRACPGTASAAGGPLATQRSATRWSALGCGCQSRPR